MKYFGVGFWVRLFGRCPFNEGFTKHLFVNGGGVRLKSCADAVTEVLSRSAGSRVKSVKGIHNDPHGNGMYPLLSRG